MQDREKELHLLRSQAHLRPLLSQGATYFVLLAFIGAFVLVVNWYNTKQLAQLKEEYGFDERMQYGGEDRELGERLMNSGFKFKQIRYSAICVHLYHERPYKNDQIFQLNTQIRKLTKKSKLKVTKFGLKKGI